MATKSQNNSTPPQDPVSEQRCLFLGRFDHALDPKKRLTIPSIWRDLMGQPSYIYVMPDIELHCLNILSPAEMERRLELLCGRPLFEDGLGEVLAELGENSEQLALDVQGRIRIRDRLLEFAQLTDQVVMIGAANRIQLWSPELRPERATIDKSAMMAAYRSLKF